MRMHPLSGGAVVRAQCHGRHKRSRWNTFRPVLKPSSQPFLDLYHVENPIQLPTAQSAATKQAFQELLVDAAHSGG
jgi:hypothetical protein